MTAPNENKNQRPGGGDGPFKSLSVKEDRFVDEWLRDFNGLRAYMVAYGVRSRKGARVAAANKLQEPHVKEAVRQRQEEIKERAKLSVDWIVAEEIKIASANIQDVFSGQWTPTSPHQLPSEVTAAVSSVQVKENGTDPATGEVLYSYKYTMWDKGKALERLSRHLGMYNDRVQAELGISSLAAVRGALEGAGEDEIGALCRLLQRMDSGNEQGPSQDPVDGDGDGEGEGGGDGQVDGGGQVDDGSGVD